MPVLIIKLNKEDNQNNQCHQINVYFIIIIANFKKKDQG